MPKDEAQIDPENFNVNDDFLEAYAVRKNISISSPWCVYKLIRAAAVHSYVSDDAPAWKCRLSVPKKFAETHMAQLVMLIVELAEAHGFPIYLFKHVSPSRWSQGTKKITDLGGLIDYIEAGQITMYWARGVKASQIKSFCQALQVRISKLGVEGLADYTGILMRDVRVEGCMHVAFRLDRIHGRYINARNLRTDERFLSAFEWFIQEKPIYGALSGDMTHCVAEDELLHQMMARCMLMLQDSKGCRQEFLFKLAAFIKNARQYRRDDVTAADVVHVIDEITTLLNNVGGRRIIQRSVLYEILMRMSRPSSTDMNPVKAAVLLVLYRFYRNDHHELVEQLLARIKDESVDIFPRAQLKKICAEDGLVKKLNQIFDLSNPASIVYKLVQYRKQASAATLFRGVIAAAGDGAMVRAGAGRPEDPRHPTYP